MSKDSTLTIGEQRQELKSQLEETYYLAKEEGVYIALEKAMELIDAHVSRREKAVRDAARYLGKNR